MQTKTAPRLVALNLGVTSEDELLTAKRFWEALLGVPLADWGHGSQQARVGTDDDFFIFNIRIRAGDEPQYGHSAAFGLAVDDVDDCYQRALDAGATGHYAPMDDDNMPRHARFADPVGNRVVIWQSERHGRP
jgi:predicted enzyme related to lactoylglutathione lyase